MWYIFKQKTNIISDNYLKIYYFFSNIVVLRIYDNILRNQEFGSLLVSVQFI